ncbi:hypothetical protein P9112_001454 [Eukaryota sp. TZLM1-RC]
MKIVPPKELSASRLVALTKPNGKVRPIAIGEAIYRLMSSVIFNRVSTKANEYFYPFQYGIKTIDGASVAALTSDLFFNCHENSCIFNLDFKNAFNSVKRDSIWKEIKSNFPELETFFYRFYGNSSDLIFNSFNLDSLSGVKQGDPLGPFFFCLAIHPILKKLKEENSDLQVVAYMDDISCIGPENTINRVANEAATLYQSIGLELNVQKCFCISRKNVKLIINSLEVPYIDYTSTSFCFLGCYLGSAEKTLDSLENYLNSIKKELEVIKTLELEKHLKFFLLKICYAGKITHLLRSLPSSLTYNFCRQFNKIRTQFLAYLMSVDPSILKNHIFSDVQLGGVGFNSSKYLTKAAFIGGGKNFVFEFCRRYPFAENLLETTNSLFLDNLREEISSLSPDLWQSCFPISIQEIPDRSLYSLKFALKKLQRHLLKKFESKDFIVRLSTAKKENPAFANFLIDLKDSSSAVLINQVPQIYGLLLNDDQWTTAMRMRCYLWPCNLPNDLFCKCGAGLTLSHLFNCNRFISYRSTFHDAVRDQIHAMCNSYHIFFINFNLFSKPQSGRDGFFRC